MTRSHGWLRAAASCLTLLALGGCPATTKRSGLGDWSGDIQVRGPEAWTPGQSFTVHAEVSPPLGLADHLDAEGHPPEALVALVTAERTFDAEGWLRLPSDEKMSTLLTPTGLPIEGGVQGPVTQRFGYPFRTPVDELAEKPFASWPTAFDVPVTLPADMPPGLYRIRVDFGVRSKTSYYDLYGNGLGSRPFLPRRGSYLYTDLHPLSNVDAHGRAVDATQLQARVPWILLASYNSNGYYGVVADEDQARFGLSSRNIIQDDVILPRYWSGGGQISYSLEPILPADGIDPYSRIPWDFSRGELSLEITNPDGSVTRVPPTPITGTTKNGAPTTGNEAFTVWKPPAYGRYTVKLTGWIADRTGRRFEGGGTYQFWIAKRMTMATATFQGNAYPAGFLYGRDMAFNPPLPAEVEMTSTLYPDSDPTQAVTATCTGFATAGGVFGAAQGMVQFPLTAPGEYSAKILARATDSEGHLWVSSMRHAGVVYPPAGDPRATIEAHGKKLYVNKTWIQRGSTGREGADNGDYESRTLEHLGFPYLQQDVLLIASDGGGANKIEPVLVYSRAGEDMAWDWKLNGVGASNLFLRTSNGLSPHLFPEYITDREYYYAAGARPGFMSRFIVGESTVFAPYWPTSPNGFGGQIGASSNGDLPGDLYRFIGGVVVRDQGQQPAYAGYIASGAILPRGSNDNRVVAPGSEDIIGANGTRARFFLVGFRPGMALPQGAGWKPAIQIDPMVPAAIRVTITSPTGRTQRWEGESKGGTFVGAGDPFPLTEPGVYTYTVAGTWSGFEGRMPGLPDSGGEIYVYTEPRPAGATGLQVNLANQSTFKPEETLTVTGRSSASTVHYALIMPGAVLGQGDVAVVNGAFSITVDPAALNRTTPIYDIRSVTSGKPQLGRVLHLTLLAEEAAPDGSRFWDFHRVVIRGNTVMSASRVK